MKHFHFTDPPYWPQVFFWVNCEENIWDFEVRVEHTSQPTLSCPRLYWKTWLERSTAAVLTSRSSNIWQLCNSSMIFRFVSSYVSRFYIQWTQEFNYRVGYSREARDRLSDIADVKDMQPFVPWFLSCNRARYPYWFGQPDPRNKDLLRALQKFFNT